MEVKGYVANVEYAWLGIDTQEPTLHGVDNQPCLVLTGEEMEWYLANNPAASGVCVWTLDSDDDWEPFNTSCGETFIYDDGDASHVKFCQHCGKSVQLANKPKGEK